MGQGHFSRNAILQKSFDSRRFFLGNLIVPGKQDVKPDDDLPKVIHFDQSALRPFRISRFGQMPPCEQEESASGQLVQRAGGNQSHSRWKCLRRNKFRDFSTNKSWG
jgi:hypothetical protein